MPKWKGGTCPPAALTGIVTDIVFEEMSTKLSTVKSFQLTIHVLVLSVKETNQSS